MGSVYRRGDSEFWWVAYVGADGRRKLASSQTRDRAAAEKVLEELERKAAAQKEAGVTDSGPLTVRRYFERWIVARRDRGVASADDDETRIRLHALPAKIDGGGSVFGEMPLDEVRARHVQAVNRANEKKGLSTRSVLHVYGVLRVMFRQAVMEELISGSPCILSQRAGELPKKRDADPTWRATAIFTRAEVEALISDERISERRRVLYALEFLAGLRANEVTPRRFRDYDETLEPLGKLTVATGYDIKRKIEKATTKTGATREVPVHPTLAAILARWRLGGWEREFGRAPTAEDLIVPGAAGGFMSSTSALKRLHEDLQLLGLRVRRQHDARRTFISLGIADGGRKDVLRWITHTPADVMDLYTTLPWSALCGEVQKINIRLREGRVLPLAANTRRYGAATEGPTNE